MSLGLPPRRLSRGLLRTMDELPVMNALNAPAELCEAVKERFLAFLNGFVVTDQTDAEPSQSITHSQGSGAGRAPPLLPVAGLGLAPSLPGNVRGCWTPWQAAACCPPGLNGASCRAPAGGRPSQPQRFYVEQLATMKERELKCLYVNFEHVAEFDQVGGRGRAGAGGERAAAAAGLHACCCNFAAFGELC